MGWRLYYKEKHGHMDVKLMHANVPIRLQVAQNWLHCMTTALEDGGHAGVHMDKLKQVFARVASILINDVPDWEDTQQVSS
jgi:hemoglobin